MTGRPRVYLDDDGWVDVPTHHTPPTTHDPIDRLGRIAARHHLTDVRALRRHDPEHGAAWLVHATLPDGRRIAVTTASTTGGLGIAVLPDDPDDTPEPIWEAALLADHPDDALDAAATLATTSLRDSADGLLDPLNDRQAAAVAAVLARADGGCFHCTAAVAAHADRTLPGHDWHALVRAHLPDDWRDDYDDAYRDKLVRLDDGLDDGLDRTAKPMPADGHELDVRPARTASEKFTDLLAVAHADRILADPTLVDAAREQLPRLEGLSSHVDTWRQLLDAGAGACAAVLTSAHPGLRHLKTDSPFSLLGLIDDDERDRLITLAYGRPPPDPVSDPEGGRP